MRRVVTAGLFLVAIGCSSSSSSLPVGGDGGAEGGVDAALDAPSSDAGVDASCAPIGKPELACVTDSDCPAAAPPQNIPSSCCGVVSRLSGSCETLSLSDATCTVGGCGGPSPPECTATTGSVGPRHLCGSASDCVPSGEQCCTVCGQYGQQFSLCMSASDATSLGAQCL